jgi:hypothetical protein
MSDAWLPDDFDYDHEDDEAIHRHQRRMRWVVGIVSALVILSLAAIPVLRIVELNQNSDPASAARDARSYVATRFSEAALENRSTRRAMEWAQPALHDQVDAIVGFLQTRDAATLADTVASVARVACSPPVRANSECFQAWLRKPGTAEVVRMQFTVSIVDGEAIVVEVRRVGIPA